MLGYELRLAWRSIRRNPLLSAIVVGGIGLGIGVATLFSTIRHSLAQDPVPRKSGVLFSVRLDNWAADRPYPAELPNSPPPQITWRDMQEITRSPIPVRQTAGFTTQFVVRSDAQQRPTTERAEVCQGDLFQMFDIPFRYGGPWSREVDRTPEPVAVISSALNDRLFGGADSVGRSLRLDDHTFRVVGVLAPWSPPVKAYDLNQNPFGPTHSLFVPIGLTPILELRSYGNSDSYRSADEPGFAGLLASERIFLQMWVELDGPASVRAYKDFLDAYVIEQQKRGRFPRPVNNRVTPLLERARERGLVPRETTVLVVVSLLFLLVCVINLSGVLLSKFLSRAAEVGVRRALGARRRDIFMQHLVECGVVGLMGGLLGLVLARAGVAWVNVWGRLFVTRSDLFRLDVEMMLFGIVLSFVAGCLSGLYPAWRICRIAPALHLKLQ